MNEIYFLLPTFNEEKRIAHIARYYSQYGKVIVIDNESEDKTADIAHSLGLTVIKKRNYGSTQTSDWFKWLKKEFGDVRFISLSCSEYIDSVTINEIKKKLSNPKVGLVELEMISFTDTKELPLWGKKKRYVQRGMNLKAVSNNVRIHADFEISDKENYEKVRLPSKFKVEHLRISNFIRETDKVLGYAFQEAKIHEQSSKTRPHVRLIKSILRDLYNLFIFKNLSHFRISFLQMIIRLIMHIAIYRELTEYKKQREVEEAYKKKYL